MAVVATIKTPEGVTITLDEGLHWHGQDPVSNLLARWADTIGKGLDYNPGMGDEGRALANYIAPMLEAEASFPPGEVRPFRPDVVY